MTQATKKPVTITAVYWDGSQAEAGNIIEWIEGLGVQAKYQEANESITHKPVIMITTLEGKFAASQGDWIIQGVGREQMAGSMQWDIYPCKPDIFDQTYDYPSEQ